MDRAERRRAGGGQRDQVVLGGVPGRRLPGRLGDPGRQRRPRDRGRQLVQGGALGGLRAQQAQGGHLVEGVHRGEGVIEPVGRHRQQVGPQHAPALVVGNQCISGTGAVAGARSR